MKKVLALVAFALIVGAGITSCNDDFQELEVKEPTEYSTQGGAGGGSEGGGVPPCPTCD